MLEETLATTQLQRSRFSKYVIFHTRQLTTEYLSFMKYVYQDVEKWLRCAEIKNDLCGYNEIVALTEFLEEIQNVYFSN